MTIDLRAIALLIALSVACAPQESREAQQPVAPDTAAIAAAADEHAGHDMDTPVTDDPHAGHGSAGEAPDPHAAHRVPAAAAGDPHAGHVAPAVRGAQPHAGHAGAAARTADPHAGHGPPRAARAEPHAGHAPERTTPLDPHAGHAPGGPTQPAPPVRDEGHDKFMLLVRSLLVDPVVQRRIEADPQLRTLWNNQSVREHILSDAHQH